MTTHSPTFAELGAPAPLVRVLAEQGMTESFPIQADTLPDTLAGRDVLGRGKTGSGKTLAFSLPLVARLAADGGAARRPRRPRALVLAPTRELANQIDAVISPLAAAYRMTTTTVYGGVSQHRQVQALNAGVDILVACPGRLEDLMKQGFVTLDGVEITVLDEADHMADLGFLPVVTRLLERTPRGGQRMLFSATLDNGVDKLVRRFLQNEVLHSVDEATSHVAAMTHHLFVTADADAKKRLVHALASGRSRRILFMRTKHQAKKLARQLTDAGIPAVDLHGNLSQPQRDRNLAAFGDGSVNVLVATDVAARGVHVDDITLVVHVDPPVEHKAYLHRSGRTARAGSAGDVVTVMLPEQRGDTLALLRKAAIKVAPVPVSHDAAEVVRLVGEPAEYVKPVVGLAPSGGGGRSQGANAQRKRAARSGAGQGERRSASPRRDGGSSDRTGAAGRRPQSDRAGQAPAAGARSGGRDGQKTRDASRTAASGRSGAPRSGMRVGDLVSPARSPRTNRRANG